MNENDKREIPIRCEQIEQFAVLHVCDELDPAARKAVDAHAAQCSACAAVLAREARLQQAIASFDQPADSLDRSGLLLAQCRSELAEALDDQHGRAAQPGWPAVLSPAAWWAVLRNTLVYHPAMSMAVLVVAGFLAGALNQRSPVVTTAPQRPVTTASVTPAPKVTEQQLQSAGRANVTWVTPSGSRTPTVQVQLMSEAPMNIVGPPDDADVLRALTFVLENGERFDPGARMDSLDVLRMRCADPGVRRSICNTARIDRNPDVRRKALETLQGFEQDPAVRQTLIEASQNDNNSAVRMAAISLLVSALREDASSGSADPGILGVLRDRRRNDPDRDVRMQTAAALRQLGATDLP